MDRSSMATASFVLRMNAARPVMAVHVTDVLHGVVYSLGAWDETGCGSKLVGARKRSSELSLEFRVLCWCCFSE